MRYAIFVLLAGACALHGCAGSRSKVEETPPEAMERPEETDEIPAEPPQLPRTYTEESTTIWSYLEGKYDNNGDQAVSKDEYGRGDEHFARLDRDRDGQITPADFQRRGRMDTMVAQMTLMRYFQADENPRDLHLTELGAVFDKNDANQDGEMAEDEFQCAVDAVNQNTPQGGARAMPRGMNPYGSLLVVSDTDKDKTLSKDELEAFFKARDDGDGVWAMRRGRGGRGNRGGRQPGAGRQMTGVPEGQPAPDFTLKSPSGDRTITLSDYRDKKPVALIFGSYT